MCDTRAILLYHVGEGPDPTALVFNNDPYLLVCKVHAIIKNGKSHSNLGTMDVICYCKYKFTYTY